MVTLYNIIGCIFMGLMAYFLWAIDGWLWMKAFVAFLVGFMFMAIAQTMQKEQCDECIEEQNDQESYQDMLDQINKSKTKWENTHE